VIYQDVYGNLITNILAETLYGLGNVAVLIKNRRVAGLSRTFNDNTHVNEDGLIALAGSHGYLEVAVANGNAGVLLEAGEGEPVTAVTHSS
jgi:S-adenosylmethionine hydrolase